MLKTSNTTYISNLTQLDNLLHKFSIENANINIMCYIWREYGFLPTIFNDYYKEFYEDIQGIFIGLCFEGHEIFYENKVDELIVLKGFINTENAYKNNIETELFLDVLKKNQDRGIAFFKTILNFDYNKCNEIINKYKWRSIIFPSLFDGWSNGAVPYATSLFIFGKGYNKQYKWSSGKYIKKWFGWNLDNWIENKNLRDIQLSKVLNVEYDTLICKNSWKTRNYRSNNIGDFLASNDRAGSVGFISKDIVYDIVNDHILKEKALVIINDLIEYEFSAEIKNNKNIHIINMYNNLDVKTLMSYAHFSDTVYLPPTAALDLTLYFCETNICILNKSEFSKDVENKMQFVNTIQKLNNKKIEIITF